MAKPSIAELTDSDYEAMTPEHVEIREAGYLAGVIRTWLFVLRRAIFELNSYGADTRAIVTRGGVTEEYGDRPR